MFEAAKMWTSTTQNAQLAVAKLFVKASKRSLKLLVSPFSFAASNQGRIAVVVIGLISGKYMPEET